MDIVDKLNEACVGHPHAKIPWPHRLLHEARDEIERLRSDTENGRLLTLVRLVLAQAHRIDDKLNDEDQEWGAQAPTGDSYNELWEVVMQLEPMNATNRPVGPSDRIVEARKAGLRSLLSDGMTQEDVLDVLHELGTGKENLAPETVIEEAKSQYEDTTDYNVSVDSNAIFSASDNGVWVSAWVFVRNEDVGLPEAFQ